MVHWHGSIRSFRRLIRHSFKGPVSPSSRAPGLRGIITCSVRISSSRLAAAGCTVGTGPIEETRPGDLVSFPPGEKHWHGTTPTTAMTHIAIQEKLDGKVIDWMEPVSDEQYQK